jgi:dihydrofolate reductase
VRRIIASEGITLDGYFAGSQGEIDWQALDQEFNAYSVELLDSVDTLLFGRVTYEQMLAWWPTPAGEHYSTEIARRMNAATKLVVSRKPVDLAWSNAQQLTGDLPQAVTELKAGTGKDIAILGSGSLVGQLTDQRLIDVTRAEAGRAGDRCRCHGGSCCGCAVHSGVRGGRPAKSPLPSLIHSAPCEGCPAKCGEVLVRSGAGSARHRPHHLVQALGEHLSVGRVTEAAVLAVDGVTEPGPEDHAPAGQAGVRAYLLPGRREQRRRYWSSWSR